MRQSNSVEIRKLSIEKASMPELPPQEMEGAVATSCWQMPLMSLLSKPKVRPLTAPRLKSEFLQVQPLKSKPW